MYSHSAFSDITRPEIISVLSSNVFDVMLLRANYENGRDFSTVLNDLYITIGTETLNSFLFLVELSSQKKKTVFYITKNESGSWNRKCQWKEKRKIYIIVVNRRSGFIWRNPEMKMIFIIFRCDLLSAFRLQTTPSSDIPPASPRIVLKSRLRNSISLMKNFEVKFSLTSEALTDLISS